MIKLKIEIKQLHSNTVRFKASSFGAPIHVSCNNYIKQKVLASEHFEANKTYSVRISKYWLLIIYLKTTIIDDNFTL